jgi:hypothetical protein
MSKIRWNFEVIALEGKIYAIGGGGYYTFNCSTANEMYDPKADKWTELAPMPTPRGNFISIVCQGKIYCIGGEYSREVLKVVEVYDPVTNRWESKEPLPFYAEDIYYSENVFKNSLQQQVVNGQIFIITLEGAMYMYDPVTDKWSNKSPLPLKQEPLRTHVINEQLFVITQNTMYTYNPVTDAWTYKTRMPTSMMYVFSVVVDNKIVVGDFLYTSGVNHIAMLNAQLRVRLYDPGSDVWYDGKTVDEHVFARYPDYDWVTTGMTSGVYAPKNVYILGFNSSKEVLGNVKPFTWVYDPVSDVWSTAKGLDAPQGSRKMVIVNDIFYAIGADSNDQYVPASYNSQGYYTPQPSAADPSTSNIISSNPPGYDSSGSFLTWSVVVVAFLIVGIVVVVALFFYLQERKRSKSVKYE